MKATEKQLEELRELEDVKAVYKYCIENGIDAPPVETRDEFASHLIKMLTDTDDELRIAKVACAVREHYDADFELPYFVWTDNYEVRSWDNTRGYAYFYIRKFLK